MESDNMGSCLNLALTAKFKPGAEEKLRELGLQLHEKLHKSIEDERARLEEKTPVQLDVSQLQEENAKMKLELEKMRAGMAYAKSQFLTLKADRDAKASKAASMAEQLSEVESARLTLEESKQESDTNLTLLGSEIENLKANNATLLENLEELREKESRDEIEALREVSKSSAALATDINRLNKQLASRDVEIANLKKDLNSKDEEITCLTTELDEQLVDIDKLNDDMTSMSLKTQSVRDQLQANETEIAKLTQQVTEATQEKILLDESLNSARAEKETVIEEKDALEAKMRYAKGQFDKMKKILEERGKQLAELKTVHEDLQTAQAEVERLNLQLSNGDSVANEELSGRVTLLESELETIRANLDESNAERVNLQTELSDVSGQLASSEAQLDALRAEVKNSQASAQNLVEERDSSHTQNEALKSDIQVMLGERDDLSLLRSQLEDTIIGLRKDLEDRDAALSMRSEQVASLEARLGELNKIEDELRIANSELDKAGNDMHHLMGTLSERDDEIYRQAKELEILQVHVLELPEVRKSLVDSQAELEGMLAQNEFLQKEFADERARVTDLESAVETSESMQQEYQEALLALKDANEDRTRMKDALASMGISLSSKDRAIMRLERDLSEAMSIAETSAAESREARKKAQLIGVEMDNLQRTVLDIQDQASCKDKEITTLKGEVTRARASLESATRTELELQSANLRFGVCEQELQILRQELQHHKATSTRLSGLESKLLSAESDKSSLMDQLEECRVRIEQLSQAEVQLQTTLSDLTAARNEIVVFEQKIAVSDALVARLQAEQEEGNASLASFTVKCQELQGQLDLAQEELAKNQSRIEELVGLQQHVMQLETALAVAGAQTEYPPSVAPTKDAESSASAGNVLLQGNDSPDGKSERSLLQEVDSLSDQLAQAGRREASLLEEVFGLRKELEGERRTQFETQNTIEEPSMPTTGSVMINMDGVTNKKDEDIHDIEATVLSGGDASGFQPIAGLIRGTATMKYTRPCIKGTEFIDRGFIVLMRQPALRAMLLVYFMLLHMIAFLFGAT